MNVVPVANQSDIDSFDSDCIEYNDLKSDLTTLLIENPQASFIGRAMGSSMQGVGIFDQDILIVDRRVELKDHDVIVANLNGEFVCKILDMKNRLLLSANPEYKPASISDYDVFSVEGVVTKSIRLFRKSHLLT